jgi:hypothetical protein
MSLFRRTIHVLIAMLVVCTPLFVAQVLLYVYHGALLGRLLPIWADEILYWHQAVSFIEAGFNSGYYSVAEVPAALPFIRFYTWGALIPALYGIGAWVAQQHLAFIPIFNLIALSLSIAIVIRLLRFNNLQSLLLGGFIGTFAPFLIYSTSSLLPLLEQAIALGMGTGFYLLIQQRAASPCRLHIAVGFFIFFACFIRVWWGLLFVPYFLLLHPAYNMRRIIGSVLVAGIVLLVCVWLTRNVGTPFPFWYSDVYELGDRAETVPEHIQRNVSRFNEGNVLEVWMRRQHLLTLGLLGVMGAGFVFRKQRIEQWLELLFCSYAMLIILVFAFVVHDIYAWRDYRILSPILLMVLTVMLGSRRYWMLLILIAFNLWLMPETLKVYDIWAEWHVDRAKHNEYFAWNAELQKVLVYDPTLESAWCNTVLYSDHYLFGPTSTLLAVDGGLGLSTPLFLEQYALPFRSRYLMLDDEIYATLENQLHVLPLMVIPDGQLYLNLDADCPSPP